MTKFLINNQEIEVLCKNNALKDLSKFIDFNSYTKVAVLTDANLANLYSEFFKENIDSKKLQFIIVESGDKNKNLETASDIWRGLLESSFDRHSLLINFGGGMISDLGGFVAATYMRGIDFINIPSTLLGQVDAAIGGKTAVNLDSMKNIVGLFVNPKKIIIDPILTKSLAKREILSGFAEIIKHAIIFDKRLFRLLYNKGLFAFSDSELEELVRISYLLKIAVIQNDFFEKGERKLLNFGHTIGHAFESISLSSKEYLTHGEAVAIGMLIESEIAVLAGKLKKEDLVKIQKLIKDNYSFKLSKNLSLKKILEKIKLDKKNVAGEINWTLPSKIASASYDQKISLDLVKKSINNFLKNESSI